MIMRTQDVDRIASDLRIGLGLLRRRLRQIQPKAGLTFPEVAALARLDRSGPTTSADLARAEQISPQSMGATLVALQERGLVARTSDPRDGRRVILSLTDEGRTVVHRRRADSDRRLALALAQTFTEQELGELRAAAPLLARLAEAL